MNGKYSLKKSAEKQAMRYNFIDGTKELVPRNRSHGRYEMIPDLRKYEKSIGKSKPEYL